MDITQVTERRALLAAEIQKIVDAFESETGARVEYATLLREDGEIANAIRKVDLTVRLL